MNTPLTAAQTVINGNLDTNNLSASAGIVGTQLSASAAIAGTQLSASAAIVDTQLASPNNSAYKTILTAQSLITGGYPAASYLLGASLQVPSTSIGPIASPASFAYNGSGILVFPPLLRFDDADYTVAGKTQKLRLRAQVNNNATAWSSVNATFGLYPVTFSGGATVLTITLGTVVSGSTVLLTNPGASQTSQSDSGDFTIPADGQYMLGYVTSATLTANAYALLSAQLQTRHV